MEKEIQEIIRIMRECGRSYGEIAVELGLKRSTVSSFCIRNNIKATTESSDSPSYRCCPECHKIFLINGNKNKIYCSTKCRQNHWKKQHAKKRSKDSIKDNKTLQKRLDFSGDKSDEWSEEKKT